MKNTSQNKTGSKATATIAQLNQLNADIESLKHKRAGLAEPLKSHYAELRSELVATEAQIRELDENWRPESLKPKADVKLREILEANGKPMAEAEIITSLKGVFTTYKIKNTLKKKSVGPKAVFTLADGKYSVKATAA